MNWQAKIWQWWQASSTDEQQELAIIIIIIKKKAMTWKKISFQGTKISVNSPT